jgi:hypothetical protein
MATGMGIIWEENPPGWAGVVYMSDVPDVLSVHVRVKPTKDGLAADAVMVERTDGHAISARDLRAVKIPSPWVLASGRPLLSADDNSPVVTVTSPGARGKSDDHWRAVYSLWVKAQRIAPRTPVRWMLTQWQPEVSDATMRRWIKRARERAEVNGWKEDQR